jgi:hypothetical protein
MPSSAIIILARGLYSHILQNCSDALLPINNLEHVWIGVFVLDSLPIEDLSVGGLSLSVRITLS